jgi:hypothetical protein
MTDPTDDEAEFEPQTRRRSRVSVIAVDTMAGSTQVGTAAIAARCVSACSTAGCRAADGGRRSDRLLAQARS